MKTGWLEDIMNHYDGLAGYQKPESVRDSTKLDSNENYVVPRQFQQDLLSGARRDTDVREYPLGGTERLISAISRYARIPPSMIAVGNGSDQILDLILANFASRRTKVLTSNPTFAFFEERCRLYSVPVRAVPFSHDMKLDVDGFLRASGTADILYLDSPNNPTGFQFPRSDLQKLVKSFDGLVIIDEAYGQFGRYSISNMTKSQDNLVVLHTLSKSFGLAGLRLGYLVSSPRFAGMFNRVIQYPYPLSSISIEAGILALRDAGQINNATDTIKSERRRIIETLRGHDAFEVFDSDANFVLFDARGAYRRVYKALSEQGIQIRLLGKIGAHEGCLRVTVGTKRMNSRFLLAVRDLLG